MTSTYAGYPGPEAVAEDRAHCTKCGAFCKEKPDNFYGWCSACESWARAGGTPVAPYAPYEPYIVPPGPQWYWPYPPHLQWRYTLGTGTTATSTATTPEFLQRSEPR